MIKYGAPFDFDYSLFSHILSKCTCIGDIDLISELIVFQNVLENQRLSRF